MREKPRGPALRRNNASGEDDSLLRDREVALATGLVSRETCERLDLYVAELQRWQNLTNLVGPGSLSQIWTRHIVDSLQLRSHAPDANRWVDLGSGAGFPGLVLAMAGGEKSPHVDLIESNARKSAFLRRVAQLTKAKAIVHHARVEEILPTLERIDVVTARALASLTQLLAWAHPLLTTGSIALFPKGRDAAVELTEARNTWTFACEILPSRTDPAASILRISGLQPRRSEG